MTIKQQGGIFGRNPTFNDLTVEGTFTSSGAFAPSGQLIVSEDGDAALVVNRNTDNGTIVQVKQANSEVGYIATQGGDLVVGTGDTSLRFIDSLDCYFPVSTSSGTTRDNAIDIGYTEARYKDLYLGGGIYLQASSASPVAANYLDDYEEGTFTPTLTTSGTDFSSVTYDPAVFGSYTKVGNVVHIQLFMQTDAVTKGSASGNVIIGGLPFTADGTSPLAVATSKDWLADHPTRAYVADGATTISLLTNANNTADDENVVVADVKTLGNDNTLRLSGTYRAS